MTEMEDMKEASKGQGPGTAAEGEIGDITSPSIEENITEVALPTASVSGVGSTTPLDPSPSPNTSLSLFPPCQSPKFDLDCNLPTSCPSSAATNSYTTDTSAPNLTIASSSTTSPPAAQATRQRSTALFVLRGGEESGYA
ncbi:hypothetical protein PQX77_021171 [Marasmius sp. AFHP31]|nr:hypothetical protein PQX77_021171 [Marasmius sp. AFHP31]